MSAESGYKVVLSSGKSVLLVEPKIKHRAMAAQAVGGRASGDQFVFVVLMAEEMLRLLIHSINDKKVSPTELLSLDALFSIKEYKELESVYRKIVGEGDTKVPLEPTVEIVSVN